VGSGVRGGVETGDLELKVDFPLNEGAREGRREEMILRAEMELVLERGGGKAAR
jgi:hypothetical protein